MNQQALFYETIFDAIGADIAAIGGFKSAAAKLWPSESPITSSAKLRNAINPEQPHKLCPDEVLQIKRLAKAVGSCAIVSYESKELGFDIAWIEPEDEMERVQKRHVELMEQLAKEMRRANELMAQSSRLKSVK